ncbi:DUF1772 domain-containing protein [Pseudomaricurvus sp. HS19]|uniref:anthrone oxygenase family protein n=1 Tax=Pseudomaricurvus sp. HS19 TaxID=2692626 RepID=UPI00136DCD7E|nr:anthrone oxygenase family protein [Pseudomaricurvus sp. HS19]MYM63138.1 DUF1772 domain-containing protein [Pseudomaricurvus sp. HS19]
MMGIFHAALITATLLCSLVAGFLFAYAVVVMPGIKSLSDRDFIRAFQVTDRVIQNNQPVFISVWVGSVVAVVAAAFLGGRLLDGVDFLLLVLAAVAYIAGVQLPTIVINVPLNNRLQALDVDALSDADLRLARVQFESRWNNSNVIRTLVACWVSVLLIVLLTRL